MSRSPRRPVKTVRHHDVSAVSTTEISNRMVTVTTTETHIATGTTHQTVSVELPAIQLAEAEEQGRMVQFLEQAFDWQQLTYILYPYFWGRLPEKWLSAQQQYDEVDPAFGKFLQAGSARVLFAVQPAYEMAIMHFLCTGEPWGGGEAPSLGDPLYRAVWEELREQQDDLLNARPFGDAWDVVVPTSLVYLAADAKLPTYDCVKASGGKAPA